MPLDTARAIAYNGGVGVCGQPYAILAGGNLGEPGGNVRSETYMMKLGWQPADAQLDGKSKLSPLIRWGGMGICASHAHAFSVTNPPHLIAGEFCVMSREIPLTQGYVAIVDDEDWPELSKHK